MTEIIESNVEQPVVRLLGWISQKHLKMWNVSGPFYFMILITVIEQFYFLNYNGFSYVNLHKLKAVQQILPACINTQQLK